MFAKHKTFYIRNGWIRKGLKALQKSNDIFSPSNTEKAIDELGIGKAMVESLRYWLDAFKLTEEVKVKGSIQKNITDFGSMILAKDEYLERKGTLWLLHYQLADNFSQAVSWYWFFNVLKGDCFDKKQLLEELYNYSNRVLKKKVSESSLQKDIQCIVNMYAMPRDYSEEDIEDAIDSSFRELNLLSELNKGKYKKNYIQKNEINSLILYYCILDRFSSTKDQEISLEDILDEKESIGKIFNIKINTLYKLLEDLESKNYINVYRRFGENHILILESNKEKILEEYYSNMNLD